MTTKPWYKPGFAISCATLAFTVVGFASLPLWLLMEARQRKRNTGHAMPLRALEDALHAQIADVAREQEQMTAALEAKQPLDEEAATHVEQIHLEERSGVKT